MRKILPILIGLMLVSVASAYAVSVVDRVLPMEQAYKPGDLKSDIPVSLNAGVRADTFWFGDYTYLSGTYYARAAKNDKASVAWTFDRGNGPPATGVPLLTNDPLRGNAILNGEGWFVQDASANTVIYFRVIDNTLNLGNYPPGMGGTAVLPPVLRGSKSLWVGIDKPGADLLCWTCGAGYGNDWCQRVESPAVAYNGTGTVNLTLTYFNDNEQCYDGTQIYLKRADTYEVLMNQHTGGCSASPGWETNGGGFTGQIGIDSLVPSGTPWLVAPVTWTTRDFNATDITGGAQNVNFIFEFISDGGLSDEDCRGNFIWGPFVADNVTLAGTGVPATAWTFETGLQGWVPGVCTPIGDYTDIVYLDPLLYVVQDPCSCKLFNNVLEMAADQGGGQFAHPVGQHCFLAGPICNLDAEVGMPALRVIFMDFDMYAELPQENGVLIRPCWRYYPFLCDITLTTDWSAVAGQSSFNYFGTDPVCAGYRYGGTQVTGDPVPPTASLVIPMIELLANCDTFAITNCTGVTNFTPLFDNLVVGVTGGVNAPSISFENGTRYQDVGSFPESTFNVRAPGPSNITYDKNMDNDLARDKCGDSLIVAGPLASGDANYYWEAKMWWRVAKRGAFQADKESGVDTAYKTWKTRVADGLQIDRPYRPEFTYGIMDSIQIGPLPQKNRFLSRFSEKDDDYLGENKTSDMLPDDVFRPGTRIEYFLTANYMKSPNDKYYYPDTTGGNFFEFEVLPGVRTAYVANCGGSGLNYCAYHPATLYIDAFNGGSQFFIENALRTILNGYAPCTVELGCPIPYDRNWDRYDMLDGSSNWNAPFARGPIAGSNNGMTLNQILGYRAILINTGTYSAGAMENWDFQLFDQWLVSPDCNANVNRQFFAMNGDKVGEILENWTTYGLPFLNNTLAATLYCDAFNGVTSDVDCGAEEHAYCVRYQQVGVSTPYFPNLIDVDAYGSWCPNLYGFNAFTPVTGSGGVGNRIYQAEEGGKSMSHAQVIRYNSGSGANYKTVLDGVSWHHMTKRNASASGTDKCPRAAVDIVEGSLSEIRAAMRWGFDATDDSGIPKLANVKDLAVCQNTWASLPADVDDASALRVNRLFQNEPNPFSPRTTIKFSLAQSGPVQIVIYDINGRQVKKLVDERMDPGQYSVVWDGTNDSSHRVGSGVYWSQMKAGSFASNKKMVVLK